MSFERTTTPVYSSSQLSSEQQQQQQHTPQKDEEVHPSLLSYLNSVEFHQHYDLVLNDEQLHRRSSRDDDLTGGTLHDEVGAAETEFADPFANLVPANAQCLAATVPAGAMNSNSDGNSSTPADSRNIATAGSGSFGTILLCIPKNRTSSSRTRSIDTAVPRPTKSLRVTQCVVKVQTSTAAPVMMTGGGLRDPEPSKDELAALRHVGQHPNLLPLLDCFPMRRSQQQQHNQQQQQQQHALVFPWMSGGDLFDEIGLHGAYPEAEARVLLYGLLQGVQHIHRTGIAHRDVKPENILLEAVDNPLHPQHPHYRRQRPTRAVLADFGLAGAVPARACCGSPLYAAPELLLAATTKRAYSTKVDLYSCGVVAYAVLTAGVPFTGNSEELFKHTVHTPVPFKARCGWSSVSRQATDLVQQLLVKDPQLRPSAEDALNHAWFVGEAAAMEYQEEKARMKEGSSPTRPPPPPPSPRGVHHVTKAITSNTKARTTSPTHCPPSASERPNRDSTSSYTRSWYSKSRVEDSVRTMSHSSSDCCGRGPDEQRSGSGSVPLSVPKMGSVTGHSLLYGRGGGGGGGVRLSPSPAQSTLRVSNDGAHRATPDDVDGDGDDDDGCLLPRQHSNSAPTLSLTSSTHVAVQMLTREDTGGSVFDG